MESVCKIEQLQDLWSQAGSQTTSEEPPERRVYVYYCEICNSVLALRNKLEHQYSFLYSTVDECPTCRFRLELSLRCSALTVRVPNSSLPGPTKQNATLCRFSDRIGNKAYPFERAHSREKRSLSFGEVPGELQAYPRQLTLLYGEKICQAVAEQLCVRSQLSSDQGGLGAASVFIDGGNTFDLYQISAYASMLELDRATILRRIKVSRAFTCYQLVNLVVEKLPKLLNEGKIGLVVIANLLDMFMDPEIGLTEAKRTISFLSGCLARLAREEDIVLVVTCPKQKDDCDVTLRQFIVNRAHVVLRAERIGRELIFVLEKHPTRECQTRINDHGQPRRLSAEGWQTTLPILSDYVTA
jgi:hypothetical protein